MLFYISYIFIVVFLFLLDYFLNIKSKFYEITAIVLVVLVSGLRNETGYDYMSYSNSYDTGVFDDAFEFGFSFFFKLLRYFNASHYVMFFVISVMIYVITYIGLLKFTKHSSIVFLIYLLIPGLYLNSLSIIRQAFAIGVCLLAFHYLINKKYLIYLTLIFLSISFHYSSAIIILFHIIALLYANKITPKLYLFFILVSIIAAKINLGALLFSTLLGASKYGVYIEGDPVNILKLIVLNISVLIPLFFFNEVTAKNYQNKYIYFFVISSLVLLNIFSSLIVVTRIAYYLKIFEPILIAEFAYIFRKNIRVFVLMLIFTFYLSIFVLSLENDIKSDNGGQSKIIPYKSIFD